MWRSEFNVIFHTALGTVLVERFVIKQTQSAENLPDRRNYLVGELMVFLSLIVNLHIMLMTLTHIFVIVI